MKNAGCLMYYRQRSAYIACADYETFIRSWAGEEWKKKNLVAVQLFCEEQLRRFGQRWTEF
jgi:hypothetical protein